MAARLALPPFLRVAAVVLQRVAVARPALLAVAVAKFATPAHLTFARLLCLQLVLMLRFVLAVLRVAAPVMKVYAILPAIAAAQAVFVDLLATATLRVLVLAIILALIAMWIAKTVANLALALLVCSTTTLPT